MSEIPKWGHDLLQRAVQMRAFAHSQDEGPKDQIPGVEGAVEVHDVFDGPTHYESLQLLPKGLTSSLSASIVEDNKRTKFSCKLDREGGFEWISTDFPSGNYKVSRTLYCDSGDKPRFVSQEVK